ncbi:PadR family transcriptional regulator [Bailinhaonella thermotolerans]|uniref:PadR family transcriptional regulator n=1 Tax=Bailinhaonella thermotolerans TaxID=1070861 RepID=A0A3A4B9U2_9ACTN|nr:PadR family transcriptional regulator [Bailinhaonella thermotolerans]RJL35659.1 PadR family transcriptional regulator [Bailinhaonella thermotolerans]
MARPLTPLALIVLRLLADEPLHPYEMQQRIRERSYDQAVKVTHGALYHTVDRLVDDGRVEPVETGREGRRPERTVYAITDRGRDDAVARLRELLHHPVEEYPRLGTALAVVSMLEPEDVATRLEMREVQLESLIAAFSTALDGLRKQGLHRVALADTEYMLALRRAELDWVRAYAADIRAGHLTWNLLDTHEEGARS